jgi:hypothetical protein
MPTGTGHLLGCLLAPNQIQQNQPAKIPDGTDLLGVVQNGGPDSSAGTLGADSVTGIVLVVVGASAVDYRFGEQAPSSGRALWYWAVVGPVLVGVIAAGVLFVIWYGRRWRWVSPGVEFPVAPDQDIHDIHSGVK